MQPSATVMSCVDDEGTCCTVFSESLGVYVSEAWGIHALNVYISYFSAGHFIYFRFTLTYPSLVQESVVRVCRLYENLNIFLAALLEGYVHFLACFSGEETIPVFSCLDFLSVDSCYDVACLYFRICDRECTVREDFLDEEAVSGIGVIVEDSEGTHVQTTSVAVSSAGV